MAKYKKKAKKYFKIIFLCVIFFVLFGLCIVLNSHQKQNNDDIKKIKKIDVYRKSVFPDNVYGTSVHTQLIEEKTDARPGIKRIILYIVIHETDNFVAGTDALNHAKYLSYNNDTSTSWHYTVDDKQIYHHIPDDEVAHHAGDMVGNEFGIGIELCVNEDGNFDKTFDNGAKLVAYLLKAYDLDISNIKTHNDFTGKKCPHSILKNNRFGAFKDRVKEYLNK